MQTWASSYENHCKGHSPARCLGAGAGRRAPVAGTSVCRARRDRKRRTGRRSGPPAATQRVARRAAGRRAAGRRHCAAAAPVHRGRLRLRRRYCLRGRSARLEAVGRATRRLPGARPRDRRLRPHGPDCPARARAWRRPADHRGQRHCQRGRRGRSAVAGPARAGDRPPPAWPAAPGSRCHRQPKPARLQF